MLFDVAAADHAYPRRAAALAVVGPPGGLPGQVLSLAFVPVSSARESTEAAAAEAAATAEEAGEAGLLLVVSDGDVVAGARIVV